MRSLFIGVLALLIGCGGDSMGPEEVDGPVGPDVRSLEIRGGLTLRPGEARAMQAVARDAAGQIVDAPEVQWSTTAPGIARVDSTGLVRGLAPGHAFISATWERMRATAQVRVEIWELQLSVDWWSRNMAIGAQLPVVATLRDNERGVDGQGWLNTHGVSWSSSDPSIATVTAVSAPDRPDATITAIAAGTATITASLAGLSASTQVRVLDPLPPGAGTLSVLDARIIEYQYSAGGGWFYAPMIRVSTGEHPVDIDRLHITFPGRGPALPFCATIRMLPFETRDLNVETYGEYQFTIDATDGSRAPAGSTFPAALEYVNGDGERLTLSLELAIELGSPPTTYSGGDAMNFWGTCRS